LLTTTQVPEQASSLVLEHVTQLRDGVQRRNVRDIVAEKIASLISSGILQVGDVLPSERDIATAIQVSRETVRGGMQILSARGIIEVSHGARTRVISADVGPLATGLRAPKVINTYDIEAIHAARMLIEVAVVAAATLRMDGSTLRLLEEALDAQRAAADDPVRFLISDREFHLAIYRTCGNPVLADFVGDLYAYMMEHRREAVSQPGAILKSLRDHEAIVAGLRARDPSAVVSAFERHIKRIYTTTIAVMGGASVEDAETAGRKLSAVRSQSPARKSGAVSPTRRAFDATGRRTGAAGKTKR
jgi:DNA-binding FadR family transcriptional regulator